MSLFFDMINRLPISAAVLAGGQNSRFNGEKSLLKIGNKTLLDNTLDILDRCFQETIIISSKEVIRERFPHRKIFGDILPGTGALAGIHSALLNASHEVVFVCACDMPNLNESLLRRMAEYYLRECPHRVLVPAHARGFEPLHSIYCKGIAGIIESQLREGNLKITALFEKVDAEYYPVADDLIPVFRNINTQADLLAWQTDKDVSILCR